MKEIQDNRSGGDRRSTHNDCTAHSGLNVKINVLLILSSLATLLLGIAMPMLSNIQANVAANTVSVKRVEADCEKLDIRVRQLEQVKSGGIQRGY